ncbi:MAG: hypothetical protein HKN14_13070 [Marinicaulis sp.]|nr:hypothetical protein [Marinicaulis sp.]NNE41836.1 hypothetical protein [Marinicaulis sp.]NNL90310.1 hypothetical protein [Marinicaulis sp.]
MNSADVVAASSEFDKPIGAPPIESPARDDNQRLAATATSSDQNMFDFTNIDQSPASYGDLLSAMKQRAESIERRNIEIENRIRVLEILEHRIESKLAELQNRNEDLSKLVSFADEASQQDIELLSKMYEQMKPQKAGEIFNKMNPEFAAGFLTEMNSESAALILTNMNTDQAYKTSMIIASRNAGVRNQ